eukprot:ANDGO_02763.mRNA.1 hypothetical protein
MTTVAASRDRRKGHVSSGCARLWRWESRKGSVSVDSGYDHLSQSWAPADIQWPKYASRNFGNYKHIDDKKQIADKWYDFDAEKFKRPLTRHIQIEKSRGREVRVEPSEPQPKDYLQKIDPQKSVSYIQQRAIPVPAFQKETGRSNGFQAPRDFVPNMEGSLSTTSQMTHGDLNYNEKRRGVTPRKYESVVPFDRMSGREWMDEKKVAKRIESSLDFVEDLPSRPVSVLEFRKYSSRVPVQNMPWILDENVRRPAEVVDLVYQPKYDLVEPFTGIPTMSSALGRTKVAEEKKRKIQDTLLNVESFTQKALDDISAEADSADLPPNQDCRRSADQRDAYNASTMQEISAIRSESRPGSSLSSISSRVSSAKSLDITAEDVFRKVEDQTLAKQDVSRPSTTLGKSMKSIDVYGRNGITQTTPRTVARSVDAVIRTSKSETSCSTKIAKRMLKEQQDFERTLHLLILRSFGGKDK